MKDKTKVYLDLSKLSGEQIKEIPNILKKGNQELYFLAKKTIESGKLDNYYKYLVFAKASINIWVFSHDKPKRIEIDLSEFRQLFSKGEEVLQVEKKCCGNPEIRCNKVEINVGDKQGTYKDLSFYFCDNCGNVTDEELS